MRTLTGVVLSFAILGAVGTAEAAYLIHFRNGKKVVVRSYEEVGDQIKYWYYGRLSVPKATIAVIEDRNTGEKRVFNPYYSEAETEAVREEQARRLDEQMEKRARDKRMIEEREKRLRAEEQARKDKEAQRRQEQKDRASARIWAEEQVRAQQRYRGW